VLNDRRTATRTDTTTGTSQRTAERTRAKGDEHASAKGIAQADANSNLATTTSLRHGKHATKPR
jgi:hypothetical protein